MRTAAGIIGLTIILVIFFAALIRIVRKHMREARGDRRRQS